MADYLVIINPASDRWRSGKRWENQVEPALKARGVSYDVVYTTGSGHALHLAAEAARSGKYGAVVSGGGDGTLNEVVNGLCQAAGEGDTLPLGIFPIGSGNDFASVLRIPKDPAGMVTRLLEDKRRLSDVGRLYSPDMLGPTAPYRYFLNNSGLGFEAHVNLESRRIQRLSGFLIYFVAVFRALVRYRQPHVRARWQDGERAEPMLLVTVGNGRRAGGGFWLTPFAEIDDGLLDVGFAKALSRGGILRLLPKAMKGRHIYDPAFDMVKTPTLVLETDIPVPVHTDGEAVVEATREARYDILPQKVWLISDPNLPLLDVFQT